MRSNTQVVSEEDNADLVKRLEEFFRWEILTNLAMAAMLFAFFAFFDSPILLLLGAMVAVNGGGHPALRGARAGGGAGAGAPFEATVNEALRGAPAAARQD